MSYKEVTALRKSGNLESALAMARADYERLQGQWESSALFWCLNDKYKTIPDVSERKTVIDEMHELAGMMPGEDEFIGKALAAADRSLSPHIDEIMAAEEQSKNGDALTAYRTLHSFYTAGELSDDQHKRYGWIIYRALRQNQKLATIERRRMLNNYLKLGLPAPSLLHSCILMEAMNTERDNPKEFAFTKFIGLWNLDNLRSEDWEQGKTQDGRRLLSLVERVITLYSREMQDMPDALPSDTFMSVLQKAADKWPKEDNLLRYQAVALIKSGRKDDAIRVYKQLVLRPSSKFYLWSELAALVNSDEEKISLLCKALDFNVSDEYLGKLHLTLADILVRQKDYGWAKAELDKYKTVYERNKWHLSRAFADLSGMIPDGTAADTQKYSDHFSEADALIFSDIPSTTLIKTGERIDTLTDMSKQSRKPKKVCKWMLLGEEGKPLAIDPHRFGLKDLPNGQCFEAKITEVGISYIKVIEMPALNWIKRIAGTARIKKNAQNRRFAFLDDSYIHEKYLADVNDGDRVEGIAVCRDGKWQCITLTKC